MTDAAVYIRQTQAGPTDAEQRAECALTATAKGFRVIGEYVDVESLDGRAGPSYREMLYAIRGRRMQIVLAYSAERMFRNTHAMNQLLAFASKGGVRFHFCRENIGTEGQSGEALIAAMNLIGRLDYQRKVERTRIVMQTKRNEGLVWGRPRSTTDETEREIQRLLDEGKPVNTVANMLGVGRAVVRQRARDRAMGVVE